MGTTRKVLRNVAAIIESTPFVYEAPDVRIPHTSFTINSTFDIIADDSVEGTALMDLPNQGTKAVEGTLAGYVDVDTIEVILEAAMGDTTTQISTFPVTKNEKTMSIVATDEVKTYKYAGCVIKSISFSSAPNGRLTYSAEVLAYTELRDDTSFPSITTEKGTRIVHHHMCSDGSGYARIGDQDNALAAGDNVELSNIEFGWEWGFEQDYANCQTTQTFLSTMCVPTLSMQISRHDTDQFHAWRDAFTGLQAELLYYASASANIKIQIPNLVLPEASVTEDDIGKIDLAPTVGRNGLGSNYTNSNMSFVSSIRITVDNS